MAKFEDYRQPWETGPHWDLKKEFIDAYQDMFEEDRLLCLAQAYANVVLMNCCYPGPVMHQISELSKPLKLRKKFQNVASNSEAETSNNEQSRALENIVSIHQKAGRSFKQIKFCPGEQQSKLPLSLNSTNLHESPSDQLQSSNPPTVSNQLNSQLLTQISTVPSTDERKEEQSKLPLSLNSTNLHESPSDQFQSSNLPTVSNQLNSQLLTQISTVSSTDERKESQSSHHINASTFIEKETEARIISALGLSYIKNFVEMIETEISHSKKTNASRALFDVISKTGIRDSSYYKFEIDHDISDNTVLCKAKLFIKNCEIACKVAPKRKIAKTLAAEAAVDTLFKISTSHISLIEDKSQVTPMELMIPPSDVVKEALCIETPHFILNQAMYDSSLRDSFVLVEKLKFKGAIQLHSRTIVHETASCNNKQYQYKFENVPGIVPTYTKAILLIGGAVVGTGVGATIEEAKAAACTQALRDLKKKYYTLRIKDEYVEGFIITRSQVFDGESFSSNVISESNIGCKMLKNMGWTGGGLGGKGIAEPIQATANLSFGSGLGFGESKAPQDSKLFRKRLEAMLRDFCKSESYSDLVFSKDFAKDERKEIHQLARRLHLHTQSRGVGDDRFLTIRQKYEATKLLKFLVKNGGSNSKFELIDDSGTQI